MNKLAKLISFIFFLLLILWTFKAWLLPGLIIGGDFWHFSPSMYASLSYFQYIWIEDANIGMGGIASVYQPIHFVFAVPVFFLGYLLHFSWENIARFGFFLPYIILGFFAPLFLVRTVFSKIQITFRFFAPFIFLFNTYFLLIVGGGQINLANSCVLATLTFTLLIYQYKNLLIKTVTNNIFLSVILGSFLGLTMVWDLRFAYILTYAYFFFLLFFLISEEKKDRGVALLRAIIFLIAIPFGLAILLNAFWILPAALLHQNAIQQLGSVYSTTGAVKFFSFASFENAWALLHPNWPENIFGLTHFMRPEFLVLPLLVYGSLLFIKPFDSLRSLMEKQEQLHVLFFALLGLLGTFLAKGVNDPFGGIYLWMFDHVPGFIMFRDPTKWYFLVVIAYAMLIPYSTEKIYEWLKRKFV